MRATEEQLRDLLVRAISDGVNRTLGVLEEAGAIDANRLRAAYSGPGSRYYDLVTAEVSRTADAAAASLATMLAAGIPPGPGQLDPGEPGDPGDPDGLDTPPER